MNKEEISNILGFLDNYITTDHLTKIKQIVDDEQWTILQKIIEKKDIGNCYTPLLTWLELLNDYVIKNKLYKPYIGTIRISKRDAEMFIIFALSKYGKYKIRYANSSSFSSRNCSLSDSVAFDYKTYARMYAENAIKDSQRIVDMYTKELAKK